MARKQKKLELETLTEGLYLAVHREFEEFLERIFMLYLSRSNYVSMLGVKALVQPKSEEHARKLLKGAHRGRVDWNDTGVVADRADIYFKSGQPFSVVIRPRQAILKEMQIIRNRVAHSSGEAETKFQNVVTAYFSVPPINRVQPGEFLNLPAKATPSISNFHYFISVIRAVSRGCTV
ncbi:MAG: hypothetical protein HY059_20640 [Proteobacteria bacterium]|nr:hypothetical protein [Pseudomonadota bacterium]